MVVFRPDIDNIYDMACGQAALYHGVVTVVMGGRGTTIMFPNVRDAAAFAHTMLSKIPEFGPLATYVEFISPPRSLFDPCSVIVEWSVLK
jgi:N-acyl-D-aspartate/D-glutamate deacylase